MRIAVQEQVKRSDIVIMAAAVSDFTPKITSDRKLKKSEAPDTLELERTVDILKELGSQAGKRLLVGFAAETDDVEQNALRKLKDKNLDLIVVNDLLKKGAGFDTDTNIVTLIDRSGTRTALPLLSKIATARRIIQAIAALIHAGTP
jgi:phosphopantothenoylcysteine decarboxylase/phosphopantothenate--cysteine ligase